MEQITLDMTVSRPLYILHVEAREACQPRVAGATRKGAEFFVGRMIDRVSFLQRSGSSEFSRLVNWQKYVAHRKLRSLANMNRELADLTSLLHAVELDLCCTFLLSYLLHRAVEFMSRDMMGPGITNQRTLCSVWRNEMSLKGVIRSV